jgi:hypothetical protein
MNEVHTLSLHSKPIFILSFYRRQSRSNGHLPSAFPTKILQAFIFCLMRATGPTNLILLALITSVTPCITFRNKLFFFFCGEERLPLVQHPNWRITSCQLSAYVYLIYSRLPAISGGCLLPLADEMADTRNKHLPNISLQRHRSMNPFGVGMFRKHFTPSLIFEVRVGTSSPDIYLIMTLGFYVSVLIPTIQYFHH